MKYSLCSLVSEPVTLHVAAQSLKKRLSWGRRAALYPALYFVMATSCSGDDASSNQPTWSTDTATDVQSSSNTSASPSGSNTVPAGMNNGATSQAGPMSGPVNATSSGPAGPTAPPSTNPSSTANVDMPSDEAPADVSPTGSTSDGFTTESRMPPDGESSDGVNTDVGDTTEDVPTDVDPDAIIVAPDGNAAAAGSLAAPTTLSAAVSRVRAGQTIYLRGGTYELNATVQLSADGTNAGKVHLRKYPLDEMRPRLDFSAMPENSSNRGLILSGDHWHIYGIDVFKAGDNCMFVSGSNNTIEFATFSECADTGLQLGNGAANNLVLNCDSFFNADSSLENADGFAAKLDVGTGNKFVGCRAWNNLDDGWDGYLRPADNVTTTHENCWAIDNGKLKNGSVGAGDGNGFKTGGSDDKALRHNAVYINCIAAGNVYDGFDHNSNRGNVTIINSAAHANGTNINFGSSNIAASLTIKNTISLGKNGSLQATTTDLAGNSWQNGRSATEADFVSVDVSQLKAPRKSDGSLPDIDYLKLVPNSDLRNAGVDVGLPFKGSAPDIGPFESDD